MSSITFRFIKNNQSSADDEMCTVHKFEDAFKMKYKYKDVNNKTFLNTVQLNADGIQQWVRRAIEMIEVDSDPFDSFQIDFPLLPSIVFNVTNVGQHYNAILDAVEFSLDNWPSRVDPSRVVPSQAYQTPQVPVARTLNFNAYGQGQGQGQDDASSISTHSSMPSLHPMQTRSQRHLFI